MHIPTVLGLLATSLTLTSADVGHLLLGLHHRQFEITAQRYSEPSCSPLATKFWYPENIKADTGCHNFYPAGEFQAIGWTGNTRPGWLSIEDDYGGRVCHAWTYSQLDCEGEFSETNITNTEAYKGGCETDFVDFDGNPIKAMSLEMYCEEPEQPKRKDWWH
ncbi:hypothetical protein LTR78_007604 [Recurvomyces mirabilis]|uniref:Uncharacterized protein n=1 Tax=Recurvomyces mirabilis TaxID=574656 RepID=A0AAE0TUP3_9PEZI|nr:hypothetical protein LTR78_007604 [Recurvomyces mirabilis]KAK5159885.1 hypothetical protein LTS14_001990 [Recurvomyces mirabilis]